MSKKVNIFWFRRDLRLDDNVGFYKALKGKYPVVPLFIFDNEILDKLPKDDARVSFIFKTVQRLRATLESHQSSIAILKGNPDEIFQKLCAKYDVQNVITNRDYEPYAQDRDQKIANQLQMGSIGFYTFKDQVLFEQDEIVKADHTPYVVYTPYMKKWKSLFREMPALNIYDPTPLFKNLIKSETLPNVSLKDIGFIASKIQVPAYNVNSKTIQHYEATRNFPSQDATSRLGPHLRFGTVSVRKMILKATAEENEVFWQELIWREFFMQILWHFPRTVTEAFKKKYDRIPWRNNVDDFEKWKTGTTGYPFVDAGMRELNATGHMHNRVRMLVASFLCKHLLIDWRWGEGYFAEKLLDYELSSNVGNWQWAAGSGVDAAPYFRIFNPTTQIDKFDKNRTYIKQWLKEYGTDAYPNEMVDHKVARERCLTVYKSALQN